MSEHLNKDTSPRGFDRYPPVESEYGGNVVVYESSAADGPHVWLKAVEEMPGKPASEAAVHLTAENAWKLADQLRQLVRDHYQGDATPEWAQ